MYLFQRFNKNRVGLLFLQLLPVQQLVVQQPLFLPVGLCGLLKLLQLIVFFLGEKCGSAGPVALADSSISSEELIEVRQHELILIM